MNKTLRRKQKQKREAARHDKRKRLALERQRQPQCRAPQAADGPTWRSVQAACNQIGIEAGSWAGAPVPIESAELVVEKRYPFQGLNGFSLSKKEDRQYDADHGAKLVNEWARPGQRVLVFENADGKREHCVLPTERPGNAVNAMMSVLDVALHAWTVEAELKAVELLRTLIKPHLFDAYVLTGTFIESSKRSGLMYLFRKLRPTLALATAGRDDMRVLCGLCLHPLGYYGGTYAGCLVPTDDVIAHLLMMRGDEHKFWAMANQFDPVTRGLGGFD